MKALTGLLILTTIFISGFDLRQPETVEFSCVKMHKASNTCHYNFKIDGAKYRYVDVGCRYNKKKDLVIKKAMEGSLALTKDWKIECPEEKK